MATVNRRQFLQGVAALGGVAALEGLTARAALAADHTSRTALQRLAGLGELRPTPANNTGEVLLALPRGFQYNVFGKAGSPMSDGRKTPAAHDGMAAFAVGGMIRLVRNHEVRNRVGTVGAAIGPNPYDPLAGGGTTTLIVDPRTRDLVADFASLSGTLVNCAGGPTPWGSWISCEETVLGPTAGFAQAHGYCFEVAATSDGTVTPVPLKAMGRFVHEAIAIDPDTGIVYETEDRGTAGLYRFIPNQRGDLAAGGRLQMLAIRGRPNYDTRSGQQPNTLLPVTWVDIDDPDPAAAETNSLAVYEQGIARGGATFARLEGAWYGNGSVYLNSTSGGDAGLGQVWELRLRGPLADHLRLVFESPSADVLDSPDNITVSPRGGVLVLCEDGDADQYVRFLTRDGQLFDFAKNIVPGFEDMEFAGATFSPDGTTLFINIQTPGLTFAIWGGW
jgi:secreted PhoX family phosphatase